MLPLVKITVFYVTKGRSAKKYHPKCLSMEKLSKYSTIIVRLYYIPIAILALAYSYFSVVGYVDAL